MIAPIRKFKPRTAPRRRCVTVSRPDPPSLQALIEQYGGYEKIPEHDWQQYNVALRRLQRLRDRARPIFVVRLRAEPDVNPIRTLRAFLKATLRRFGLRCMSINQKVGSDT
jgi:hypothetical protein